MAIRHDSDYRCCCGVHVHNCTFVLALVLVVFTSLITIGIVFGASDAQGMLLPYNLYSDLGMRYSGGVGFFIGFLSYICLLIGNVKYKSIFYIPYLILQIISLIGLTLFLVPVILVVVVATKAEDLPKNEAIVLLVSVLIFYGLVFYVFYIVYRDYKYVKETH